MTSSPPTPAPPGLSASYWRLLLQEPLADALVLDVGTGAGTIALALAPHCRAVVGIDQDAAAIADATRAARAAGTMNVSFRVADADSVEYADLVAEPPALVTAHLFMSAPLVERSARVLPPGGALAIVAFHTDQWMETGRRSRFAYDEERMRQVLAEHGFTVEHLEVDRRVQSFGSVEEALAAAITLSERWRSDGRWFRYIKFLEEGGRTLTRSHLIVKARRTA